MNTGMIPARYAKALLVFAEDKSIGKELYGSAKMLVDNFRLQPRINAVLENPIISSVQKKQLILTASQQKSGSLFESFLDLLIKNRRLEYIYLIMLKYIDLYRESQNLFAGKVISATSLDETTIKRLRTLIEARKKGTLELQLDIQPELLGGFVLEIDNTRWDASVKRQLQQIKNELLTK